MIDMMDLARRLEAIRVREVMSRSELTRWVNISFYSMKSVLENDGTAKFKSPTMRKIKEFVEKQEQVK